MSRPGIQTACDKCKNSLVIVALCQNNPCSLLLCINLVFEDSPGSSFCLNRTPSLLSSCYYTIAQPLVLTVPPNPHMFCIHLLLHRFTWKTLLLKAEQMFARPSILNPEVLGGRRSYPYADFGDSRPVGTHVGFDIARLLSNRGQHVCR